MRSCSLCGFSSEFAGNRNISFHHYPKDEILKQQWIEKIGKKNYTPAKTAVVCSLHFTKECLYYALGGQMKKQQLKPGSVPSIFGFRMTYSKEKNEIDPLALNPPCLSGVMNLKELDLYLNATLNAILPEKNSPDYQNSEMLEYSTYLYDEHSFMGLEKSSSCDESISQSISLESQYHENAEDSKYEPDEYFPNTINNDEMVNSTVNSTNLNQSNFVIDKEYKTESSGFESPALIERQCNNIRHSSDSIGDIEKEKVNPTTSKRKRYRHNNPRYVGDCEEDDLKCPLKAKRNWQIATNEIVRLRRMVSTLQQNLRRQEKKINYLKSLLKRSNIISRDTEVTIDTS